VDLQILPEPTEEERRAIVEALRTEAAEGRAPSPWQRQSMELEARFAQRSTER
jgi:hypothetical protein